MPTPLWITEADVVALLDLGDAMAALENGLRAEAAGQAVNMVKTHVAWGHNTLHAIGAVSLSEGLAATKTWAHTEGGATPLVVLIDAEDGSLKAVIEAFALGQLRTGGISGVATDWLAEPQADEMAIVGTGKQALMQVAAVAAARPLRRLRVFSPKGASRQAFIAKVRAEFEFEVVEAQSVGAAIADAPIVTLVTRATAPFVESAMLGRGAHVNAVGAITPEREELAQNVFERVTRIAVDNLPAAQKLSRELRTRYGVPGPAWGDVLTLSQVVAADSRRGPRDDLSVFKAMGMGLSDLALAVEIHSRAKARGVGRPFPHPERATPRFRVERGTTAVAPC